MSMPNIGILKYSSEAVSRIAFDKCQLCKKQGVTRMWLILSRPHFLCCTVSGCVGLFDEGCNYFRNRVLQEIFLKMLSLRNRSIFVLFFGFAHS